MRGIRTFSDPAFVEAQRRYFAPGAEQLPYDMDPYALARAHDFSVNLPQGLGQEMCGWINVERYFVARDDSEAEMVRELSHEAFGRAYDQYQEADDAAGQFRLQLVHAHLEEYALYAEDTPISREIKAAALDATSEIGRRMLEFYDHDPLAPRLNEPAMTLIADKIIAILGLGMRAGDTRSPDAPLVTVPATMRQEMATTPGVTAEERRTRVRWSLSALKNTPNGWRENGILIPQAELETKTPNVIIADGTTLGISEGDFGHYEALRTMVINYSGGATPLVASQASEVGRRLQRLLKNN
ncbi:MAG TPA: hypothetical protein VFI74_05790 [Candidatus Saccharimonadales bacterium]|nr:hypothetical protein [Candidatus Saccharimonadales bacterium]